MSHYMIGIPHSIFNVFQFAFWLVYNGTSFNRTPSSAILIMSLAIKYNNNDIEWENRFLSLNDNFTNQVDRTSFYFFQRALDSSRIIVLSFK